MPQQENPRPEQQSDKKNVGESDLRRGEDIVEQEGKEPGRKDGPPKGESQRPTGKSTPRDQTGISPSQKH